MIPELIIVFVSICFELLSLSILIRVILSWLPMQGMGKIRMLFHSITEPIMTPFRKIIPPLGGVLDISPIVALFTLQFLRDLIIKLLTGS